MTELCMFQCICARKRKSNESKLKISLFLMMHMFIKDCCPTTNIHEKKQNNTANNYLTLLFWMTSFSNLKEKRRILGVHYNKWKQCTIISISVKKSKVSVYAVKDHTTQYWEKIRCICFVSYLVMVKQCNLPNLYIFKEFDQ